MNDREGAFPLAKAFVAVAVWGASFVSTKIALSEVSPITVVWLRFTIGVAFMTLAVYYRKQFDVVALKELPYFVLLGLLGITFHQWLQSNALLTAQATTTGWIITTTPVFMALLGRIFLKERLSVLRIGGIGIASIGVILVVSKGNLDELWNGKFGTIGDFLILISALNWAVFSVASRKVLRNHQPGLMMFYVMLFGWLLCSFEFIVEDKLSQLGQLTALGWTHIAFLGFFCSGLAYVFWYDSLKALNASQVGVLLYFEPLVTVVVSAMLLTEPITILSLFGGALILFGVWMVNRPQTANTD